MSIPPQSALRALAELARNLYELWPNYETVEANLAQSSMAAAAGGEGRPSGTYADPTLSVVVSHQRYYETTDHLEQALRHLRDAQHRITDVQRNHAPLARVLDQEAKSARCDGSWDPTCVNNAVRNGKCWRCIKAEQRARDQDK
jgi:hypothetical protein